MLFVLDRYEERRPSRKNIFFIEGKKMSRSLVISEIHREFTNALSNLSWTDNYVYLHI